MSKKYVYTSLNRSRGWLDYQFTRENITLEELNRIGEVLNHDFTTDLFGKPAAMHESRPVTQEQIKQLREEVETWKSKYLNLLEEHSQVLRELNAIKNPG